MLILEILLLLVLLVLGLGALFLIGLLIKESVALKRKTPLKEFRDVGLSGIFPHRSLDGERNKNFKAPNKDKGNG